MTWMIQSGKMKEATLRFWEQAAINNKKHNLKITNKFMPSIEKKRNSFSSPLFLQSLDHPIFKKKKKICTNDSNFINTYKGALSCLWHFSASESPLKITKNSFYFISFCSQDTSIFVLTFWSCRKTQLD